MSDQTIARVRYFDRQFLRAQDFVDEQAYHLAQRRRHDIGPHVWGIVSGLEPAADADGVLSVNPGVAVDGYGRTLVLAERAFLPIIAFDDKASEELDVWLLYDRVGSDRAPRGYADCGDPGTEGSFYRWQERPLVRFDVPDPAFPDPREPESVPPGDLRFDSSRTPPDEVSDDWPVYLGRIRRDRSDPKKTVYVVELTGRPYVGLVGAAIEAPWDRSVRVELGGDQQDGPPVFAVFPDPGPEPALAIDGAGAFELRGRMTLHGDLEIRDGYLELGVVQAESAAAEEARPWRIYRHSAAATGEIGDDQRQVVAEELRIEMGAGASRVAVGSWSAEEKTFVPCLTVQGGSGSPCVVTVHGNLVVKGDLDERSAQAAQSRHAATEQVRLASFLSGVGGSNLFVAQPGFFVQQPVTASAATPDVLAAAIERLAADPVEREVFAHRVRSRGGDLAEALRQDLAGKE